MNILYCRANLCVPAILAHRLLITSFSGGVAERLIAPVLKTGRPKGLVSSNLTPSASSTFDVRCPTFEVHSATTRVASPAAQKQFRESRRQQHRTNNAPQHTSAKNRSGSGLVNRPRRFGAALQKIKHQKTPSKPPHGRMEMRENAN